MSQSHSHLSGESYQEAITTVTHLCILLQFIIRKQIISPLLKTMWYQTYGCANQYHCASSICLLSFLALEFSFVVERAVVPPGHGKDVVDGLNDRYKWIPKLVISNILNPELILVATIFQVHAGS